MHFDNWCVSNMIISSDFSDNNDEFQWRVKSLYLILGKENEDNNENK